MFTISCTLAADCNITINRSNARVTITVGSVPVAATVEPAPVAPTIEPVPVAPTIEPAPVAPTIEPAPVAPTIEPAPVAATVELAQVAPTIEPAPVAATVELAQVAPTIEPAPVAATVEPAPVAPTTMLQNILKRVREHNNLLDQPLSKKREILITPTSEYGIFLEHVKKIIDTNKETIDNLVKSIIDKDYMPTLDLYINIPHEIISKVDEINSYFDTKYFRSSIVTHISSININIGVIYINFCHTYSKYKFKLRFIQNNSYF